MMSQDTFTLHFVLDPSMSRLLPPELSLPIPTRVINFKVARVATYFDMLVALQRQDNSERNQTYLSLYICHGVYPIRHDTLEDRQQSLVLKW
jgi:hypothetical protein